MPSDHPPYFMTNKGLQIQFKFYDDSVLLDCTQTLSEEPLAISLRPIPDYDSTGTIHFRNNQFARLKRRSLRRIYSHSRNVYRERTIFFKSPDTGGPATESWDVCLDLSSERSDYSPFSIVQVWPRQYWGPRSSKFFCTGVVHLAEFLFADRASGCWLLIVGCHVDLSTT